MRKRKCQLLRRWQLGKAEAFLQHESFTNLQQTLQQQTNRLMTSQSGVSGTIKDKNQLSCLEIQHSVC